MPHFGTALDRSKSVFYFLPDSTTLTRHDSKVDYAKTSSKCRTCGYIALDKRSPVISRIQPALDFWRFFVLLYLAPIKQHKIIVNGVGLECENVLEIWGEILGKCISKNWEGFVVISRSLGWPTPENLTRHFLTLS